MVATIITIALYKCEATRIVPQHAPFKIILYFRMLKEHYYRPLQENMKSNAEVDFTIFDEDMEFLKNMEQMKDYGEASIFPVYGGKLK